MQWRLCVLGILFGLAGDTCVAPWSSLVRWISRANPNDRKLVRQTGWSFGPTDNDESSRRVLKSTSVQSLGVSQREDQSNQTTRARLQPLSKDDFVNRKRESKMGNCCSGGNESKKPQAFASVDNSDGFQPDLAPLSAASAAEESNGALSSLQPQDGAAALQQQQATQLKALREEQNRLDLIVQMAGRGMVSVRSTRGSTGYYDQGFAAALGQHLEQTTKFPDQLPIRLPPISSSESKDSATAGGGTGSGGAGSASSSVFQRLSQPQWDNIALGKKGTGLAGCDGENPITYMDHVAVSFLDSAVPKKERIFHGVGPMIENLV